MNNVENIESCFYLKSCNIGLLHIQVCMTKQIKQTKLKGFRASPLPYPPRLRRRLRGAMTAARPFFVLLYRNSMRPRYSRLCGRVRVHEFNTE